MSLINDALKRTRDASYQSAAKRPDVGNGYRIESGAPLSGIGSHSGTGTTLVVAAIAITVGVVFATRFVKHARTINAGFDEIVETPSAPKPIIASPKPNGSGTPSHSVAVPDPVGSGSASAPQPNPSVAEDKLVAKVMDKIKAEQAAAKPPAPEPPKLVLQGVTSDGATREAMINGINVHEGDDIDGARVVAIEPRRVKLSFGEREIVVRLP